MRQLHIHRLNWQKCAGHLRRLQALLCVVLAWELARAGSSATSDIDLNASDEVEVNASNASAAVDVCHALSPQDSPYANYDAILRCLETGERKAILRSGVYLLHRGLSLPPHSRIEAEAGASQRPVLQIAAPTAVTDYVIRTNTNTALSFITLDGADNLAAGCCTSVVTVTGSASRFEDIEAKNVMVGVGVYFIDATSTDNEFHRVRIQSCHYGVIFAHGLTNAHRNLYQDGVLENIACDAITFAGYGQAIGNLVRNNGFGCGPSGAKLPGGGVRCLGNKAGGVIVGNTIKDNCGMSLDMDSCTSFNVSYNTLSDPGNTFDGTYPFCAGAVTVTLLDSQYFLVQGNNIANSKVSNMLRNSLAADQNDIFRDTDAAALTDLPAGENTVLNFVIARRPLKDSMPSIGHHIVENQFQSSCSKQRSACLGVGYFAGRGTGYVDGTILLQEQKPSNFTGNDPLNSDLGSKRCGSNWYASNSPDCLQDAVSPCNRDDHLHGRKPFRNDDCSTFASQFASPGRQQVGQLRVPLPVEHNQCVPRGSGGPHVVC